MPALARARIGDTRGLVRGGHAGAMVATHRIHHHRSDERPDPHSPLVNLFWSHMGWLFVENTDLGRNVAYDRYARDILRDGSIDGSNVMWGITLAQSVIYFATAFLIELALGGPQLERSNSARASGCGAWSCGWWWSAHHLDRELTGPCVWLPELRHRRPQPQQYVGGNHDQRRGLAQQSPCRASCACNQRTLVGDRPDLSAVAPSGTWRTGRGCAAAATRSPEI